MTFWSFLSVCVFVCLSVCLPLGISSSLCSPISKESRAPALPAVPLGPLRQDLPPKLCVKEGRTPKGCLSGRLSEAGRAISHPSETPRKQMWAPSWSSCSWQTQPSSCGAAAGSQPQQPCPLPRHQLRPANLSLASFSPFCLSPLTPVASGFYALNSPSDLSSVFIGDF